MVCLGSQKIQLGPQGKADRVREVREVLEKPLAIGKLLADSGDELAVELQRGGKIVLTVRHRAVVVLSRSDAMLLETFLAAARNAAGAP